MQIDVAWYLVLTGISVAGLFNSFILGDITSYSSMFPASYLTIMFVGQGISGLVINIVKIIMIVSMPPDITEGPDDMKVFYNSIVFLTFGLILLLATLVLFYIMMGLEFTKYYAVIDSKTGNTSSLKKTNTCYNAAEGMNGMIFYNKTNKLMKKTTLNINKQLSNFKIPRQINS